MRCLYCHKKADVALDLMNLFSVPKRLCLDCEMRLRRWRPGARCGRCSRIMEDGSEECGDCLFLEQRFQPVRNITCMLDYNSEVKMLMHRYKFVRDVALAEVLSYFVKINKTIYDHIVPVPVSKKRFRERGFNQITEVLDRARIGHSGLLVTEKVQLQSERSKSERMQSANPFTFNERYEGVKLQNTRILIVDDIYTTGITVHHAAEVLLKHDPDFVDVLTFSKA